MLHKSLIDIAQQLTSIMVVELSALRDEERHPSRTTDDSEDFMKDQKQKLDNLDRIRREVESIAAGYPGTRSGFLQDARQDARQDIADILKDRKVYAGTIGKGQIGSGPGDSDE